jgi:hypothetical protein
MKRLMFVAALMLGGSALAQNTAPQDPPAPEAPTTTAEDPATAPDMPDTMPPNPAPADTTAPPPATDAPATTDAPPAAAPATPMQQPSGVTVDDPSQSTGARGVTQQGTDPNGTATPGAAPASYPACSRTVTDSCVQTYERGRRPRR